MPLQIQESTATEASLTFAGRMASVTVAFKSPAGVTLSSPTVTVDSIGNFIDAKTSISTVTSDTEITVADPTGITVGQQLWLASSNGWGALVRVSEVSGSDITLESPPPGQMEAGGVDTLYGGEARCTIPAQATRDTHYRLEWVVTDSDGKTHKIRTMAHVVRTPFRDAVTPSEASRYIASAYPPAYDDEDHGYFRELARRASNRVYKQLVTLSHYPHLIGDHEAFVDAGIIALQLELAREGNIPAGMDPSTFQADLRKALKEEIKDSVSGCRWTDDDDSGSVDTGEVRSLFSIDAERV